MLLKAQNLGFHYGPNPWLFKGVNITLKPGEIVGLIGPSGCGKTTLGRILAGYERPQVGSVQLFEHSKPRKGYNPVQLVFQHPEKAVNPRWKLGKTLQEGWQPDQEILQALGIEKAWLNRWPNELSGGELQRFCLARALGPETKFLIADEMTTMLDAITQAQIWQVVLEMVKQRNLGVLIVSHESSLIKRLCDRVIDFEGLSEEKPNIFRQESIVCVQGTSS